MSEYQYYEFQAIDRPLNRTEMTELRALSTRARITATRFQNVYHWGDFKGDPLRLMERYFDAFVYVANWGTHEYMLRLPRNTLDPELARRYCTGEDAALHLTPDHLILQFSSEDEEGARWVEDEEAEGWLPALLPVRAELMHGDLRALYLAWLARAQRGMLDDELVEPPVPSGLGRPSASLEALAEFLRVDSDLLAVAAERSAVLPETPPAAGLEAWLRALPESEKDDLLLRLARGDDPHLRAGLLRRFGEASAASIDAGGGRTVGELLQEADRRAEVRRQQEAEREAAEQARRAREQAAARAAYLDSLAGREEDLWRQVATLIETKRPKDYDRSVELLTDLRDLSARQARPDTFAARLAPLRERYAKRPSLLKRLDRAGLTVRPNNRA